MDHCYLLQVIIHEEGWETQKKKYFSSEKECIKEFKREMRKIKKQWDKKVNIASKTIATEDVMEKEHNYFIFDMDNTQNDAAVFIHKVL